MPLSSSDDCRSYFPGYGCTRSVHTNRQGPACLDDPVVVCPILDYLHGKPGRRTVP
ncbi:MAG: hypothetical protein QMD46_12220 [Methanomicrobiales archaeon]|nr:hypothetical protein [Methanomicrobiales archaeon]